MVSTLIESVFLFLIIPGVVKKIVRKPIFLQRLIRRNTYEKTIHQAKSFQLGWAFYC